MRRADVLGTPKKAYMVLHERKAINYRGSSVVKYKKQHCVRVVPTCSNQMPRNRPSSLSAKLRSASPAWGIWQPGAKPWMHFHRGRGRCRRYRLHHVSLQFWSCKWKWSHVDSTLKGLTRSQHFVATVLMFRDWSRRVDSGDLPLIHTFMRGPSRSSVVAKTSVSKSGTPVASKEQS